MRTANIALLALVLLTIGTIGGTAVAQKASVPKPQDKVALGEEDVKRLLLLMDADKNGRTSKQEFMTFMEAEFKRLDKNQDGELDVEELTRSEIQVRHRPPHSSAEQR